LRKNVDKKRCVAGSRGILNEKGWEEPREEELATERTDESYEKSYWREQDQTRPAGAAQQNRWN
jgi:hypothetical protein